MPNDFIEYQNQKKDILSKPWFKPLCEIVGSENVLYKFPECLAYGRDRAPFATLKYKFGKFPLSSPYLVVSPVTYDEVSEILRLANQYELPVVPYGAGSGVMGGAVPIKSGITIDLKRLKKIINIDRISCTATAQAGLNGELFEAALNKDRMTLGHFPQSLNMSTIGGWVACRSAGQASSRYRTIEDMVIGLKTVLPGGQQLEVCPVPRRAVGPSIKDLFIGSEGTMGVIVEATFRVWPYPDREATHVVGFKDYLTGLEAIRKIMQSELRPAVIRLYDEFESRPRIANLSEYKNYPCICMFSFNGIKELVEVEKRLTLKICSEVGGIEGSPRPAYDWMQKRYESLTVGKVFKGRMADTIEVAATWINLHDLYEGINEAVKASTHDVKFGAHWSHFYSDGACMYITFDIPASDETSANSAHGIIWENVMRACIKAGGTISHHHGIGYLRSKWLKQELGEGHNLLQSIKNAIDPNQIMNPGKLGF
jgi:alkyldihydroxyacetonephosphate synthase